MGNISLEFDFAELLGSPNVTEHSNDSNGSEESFKDNLDYVKLSIQKRLEKTTGNDGQLKLFIEGCGFFVAIRGVHFDESQPKYITGFLTCHHVIKDSLVLNENGYPRRTFRIVNPRELTDQKRLIDLGTPIHGYSRSCLSATKDIKSENDIDLEKKKCLERKELDYAFYPCTVPGGYLLVYRGDAEKGMEIDMRMALRIKDKEVNNFGKIADTNKSMQVEGKSRHVLANLESVPGLSGCPVIRREVGERGPELVCLHRGSFRTQKSDNAGQLDSKCETFATLAKEIEEDIQRQILLDDENNPKFDAVELPDQHFDADASLRIICEENRDDEETRMHQKISELSESMNKLKWRESERYFSLNGSIISLNGSIRELKDMYKQTKQEIIAINERELLTADDIKAINERESRMANDINDIKSMLAQLIHIQEVQPSEHNK